MTRPLIGITTEVAAAIWRDRIREAVLSPAACAIAVERAGGRPVLLPPMLPDGPDGSRDLGQAQPSPVTPFDREAARLLEVLDGVLLRAGPQAALGGAWLPGQRVRPEVTSTSAQAALIRAAVDGGVPFLAVGAGLLALNLVTGGTLDTAAPGGARAAGPSPRSVEVQLAEGSKLAGLLSATSVTIATGRPGRSTPLGGTTAPASVRPGGRLRLGRLGHGLTAAGHGPDQSVLAVEVTGHPFGVGVAWHPEEGADLTLLTAWLAAAGQRRPVAVQPA